MMKNVYAQVEKVGQQNCQDYGQSYVELGHIVMDLPIIHQFPSLLSELLPRNYRAVSLGSSDGKETDIFVEEAKKQHKQGVFINVDPFINRQNVLKITGEQFVAGCEDMSMDLILGKFSFHFNKNQPAFFRNVHRCLKDNGKLVLTQIGTECRLPWSNKIQETFLQNLPEVHSFCPPELFKWELKKETKQAKLNKEMFRDFVKNRTWSNLLINTQQEIDECLKEIDQNKELPEATLSIWVFIIEKK